MAAISGKPPLLFLAHRIPYPPDKGDKIRSWNILHHLAERFAVSVGCFADDALDFAHEPRLREVCCEVFLRPLPRALKLFRAATAPLRGISFTQAVYRDGAMAQWVHDRLARPAIRNVFVFCSSMFPYVAGARDKRLVVDLVDVDSQKWDDYARRAHWPLSALYRRERNLLLGLERKAALAACKCLLVSEAEARLFRASAPEAALRLAVIENGVDTDYFDPGRTYPLPEGMNHAAMVFTGAMDYPPNIDAVVWFAEEIFPCVRKTHPAAQFWIVGAHPGSRVRSLGHRDGIRVTGRVDDVRPYLAGAQCSVVPLRIARGIQNKLLEAMAMGKPAVATAGAAEGLVFAPGECLLADDPATFARQVGSVLDKEHAGMADLARARMRSRYGWAAKLLRLDDLFRTEPASDADHRNAWLTSHAIPHHANPDSVRMMSADTHTGSRGSPG